MQHPTKSCAQRAELSAGNVAGGKKSLACLAIALGEGKSVLALLNGFQPPPKEDLTG
jgi:hypothetical protein